MPGPEWAGASDAPGLADPTSSAVRRGSTRERVDAAGMNTWWIAAGADYAPTGLRLRAAMRVPAAPPRASAARRSG